MFALPLPAAATAAPVVVPLLCLALPLGAMALSELLLTSICDSVIPALCSSQLKTRRLVNLPCFSKKE